MIRNSKHNKPTGDSDPMAEYATRRKCEIITSIIMILLAVIGMVVIAALDLDMTYGLILFVVILMIYGLSVYKFRIGFCPYCESFMGKGVLFRTHCPRCGRKLRK